MIRLAATVIAIPARPRRGASWLEENQWTGPPLVVPWEVAIGRFLNKIILAPTGCWGWSGAVASNGYLQAKVHNLNKVQGHRIAHVIFIGPIPQGYEVDHLCFNRTCVNPGHLEAVTPQENVRRREAHRTTCKQGHALVQRKGQRHCPECNNEARRQRRAAARRELASNSLDGAAGRVPGHLAAVPGQAGGDVVWGVDDA